MSTNLSQLDEVKTGRWSGGRNPLSVEYGKLMIWIFLVSDTFTFSAFLIFYGAQRFAQPNWPNPDIIFESIPYITEHGTPLVFVGIMTFILIMSSVTMVLAVEAGHRNSRKEVIKWMIWTIIGGLTFLGCQALEWAHLHHEGFWFGAIPDAYRGELEQSSIQFSSLFFTITGFHGFHVTTGIIINIIVLFMTLANVFERRGTYLMIEKVGLYWHFVDLVWVFVFTLFYLV